MTTPMSMLDALGYLAAGLVLATFCAKSMVLLRMIAIVSNIAFIAYGFEAGLWPILVLHTAMLPLNLLRLRGALRVFAPWHNPCERRALDPLARSLARSVGLRSPGSDSTARRRTSQKQRSPRNVRHLAHQGVPQTTAHTLNRWKTQCAARSYSSSQ
jgi:hypothetical protein